MKILIFIFLLISSLYSKETLNINNFNLEKFNQKFYEYFNDSPNDINKKDIQEVKNQIKILNSIVKKHYDFTDKQLNQLGINYVLKSSKILGQYDKDFKKISINKQLFKRIGPEKYYYILRHEYGHFIIDLMNIKEKSHGNEWKKVMNILGDKNPDSNTHSYNADISNSYYKRSNYDFDTYIDKKTNSLINIFKRNYDSKFDNSFCKKSIKKYLKLDNIKIKYNQKIINYDTYDFCKNMNDYLKYSYIESKNDTDILYLTYSLLRPSNLKILSSNFINVSNDSFMNEKAYMIYQMNNSNSISSTFISLRSLKTLDSQLIYLLMNRDFKSINIFLKSKINVNDLKKYSYKIYKN